MIFDHCVLSSIGYTCRGTIELEMGRKQSTTSNLSIGKMVSSCQVRKHGRSVTNAIATKIFQDFFFPWNVVAGRNIVEFIELDGQPIRIYVNEEN